MVREAGQRLQRLSERLGDLAAAVLAPLIVYDPSPRADATRGTVCDALVEAIDLAATFVGAAGGRAPGHILEGRSLLPWLHGEEPGDWRGFAVSEYDYAMTPMATRLGVSPRDARLFMIADERFKFVHAEGGFRPMLYDLAQDPDEFHDIGGDPAARSVIDRMEARLGRWARRPSQRVTVSDEEMVARRGRSRRRGILLGVFDEAEVEPELLVRYRGRARRIHLPREDEPDE